MVLLVEELDWSKLKIRHRGQLPHWEIPGMTAFITFRLWDSLPASVVEIYREEVKSLLRKIEVEGATKETRQLGRLLFSERIEKVLDSAMGSCLFRQPAFGKMVMNAVMHFDGKRYALHALAVMPNHVHVVASLEPTETIESVTHSWKSFTANQGQKLFGHEGKLWQTESFDHIVRDQDEFDYYVRYTLENPIKANLKNWPLIYEAPKP